MPRKKLSEYRAKTIVSESLGLSYIGWPIDLDANLKEQLQAISSVSDSFVVKVDEGVKGRFKKGLVLLDVKIDGLDESIRHLKEKGYRWLIIEPMIGHDDAEERYLSLISDREGLTLQYTSSGGVDVESNAETIAKIRLDDGTDWGHIAEQTGIAEESLRGLVKDFKDNYFVFLEINPYIANGDRLQILDTAVEVDDAAAFFVDSWHLDDFRSHGGHSLSEEEKVVQELDDNSPASLKLSVLEPNGSIFLLLSGGGASVVVADEVYNQGYGKQLANYGEYSGNPNTEETYSYAKQLIHLLLKSRAERKVLFIGGAVANFTDVAKTFAGVIRAIDEGADQLREQGVKVFVRRGGPNQEEGLAKMESTLKNHGLLGAVHSPDTPLTTVLTDALKEIGHA
jgi:ATP-citrate lyase beta-subunit